MFEADLAERQYGLVTRAQAMAEMSPSAIDRRLQSGRWVRVFPSVYRLAGAPITARQRVMAVTLWAGDGAAASHLVAARLLRLELPRPTWIDVTIPRCSSLSAPDVAVHRAPLARADFVFVDGIPCTAATRTLVDCASFVGGEAWESAFERARRLGLTSVRVLAQRIGQGRAGSATIRRILAEADKRPRESRLEVKLARVLRGTSLPRAVAQFPIGGYRVDFAWPEHALVCECDGFAWHGDRLSWKYDRRRIAAIERAGWRVVHVTWDDVTEAPDDVIARLAIALQRSAA
jgi:very-short-patch-repair endonuclease